MVSFLVLLILYYFQPQRRFEKENPPSKVTFLDPLAFLASLLVLCFLYFCL